MSEIPDYPEPTWDEPSEATIAADAEAFEAENEASGEVETEGVDDVG